MARVAFGTPGTQQYLANGVHTHSYAHTGGHLLVQVHVGNGLGTIDSVRVLPAGGGSGDWVTGTAIDEHQNPSYASAALRLYHVANVAAGTVTVELTTTTYTHVALGYVSVSGFGSYGSVVKGNVVGGSPSVATINAGPNTSVWMGVSEYGDNIGYAAVSPSTNLYGVQRTSGGAGPFGAAYIREANGFPAPISATYTGAILAWMALPIYGATNYAHVRRITIDHTKVGDDCTNYRLLFEGTYAYLKTVANGGEVEDSAGDDIGFFADETKQQQYVHELDAYDPTTGYIRAWVLVPAVANATDTELYIANGDSAVTTSQADAATVHKDALIANHLSNPSSLQLTDSTGRGHSLTNNGASATTGIRSGFGAASVNGTNYLQAADHNDLTPTSGFTARILFYRDAATGQFALFDKYQDFAAEYVAAFIDAALYAWIANNAGGYQGRIANSTPANGAWHLLHYVVSGAGGTASHDIRVDGVNVDNANFSNTEDTFLPTNTSRPLSIGRTNSGTGGGASGKVALFLIDNAVRSVGWCLTETNNILDPSTFYSVSADLAGGGDITGDVTASVGITASAVGVLPISATASASVGITASAVGVLPISATASASIGINASAIGINAIHGAATAAVGIAASAVGVLPISATASGSIGIAVAATGTGSTRGDVTATISFAVSAVGVNAVRATASAQVGITATSVSVNAIRGQGNALVGLTAQVVARNPIDANAIASISILVTATGATPDPVIGIAAEAVEIDLTPYVVAIDTTPHVVDVSLTPIVQPA